MSEEEKKPSSNNISIHPGVLTAIIAVFSIAGGFVITQSNGSGKFEARVKAVEDRATAIERRIDKMDQDLRIVADDAKEERRLMKQDIMAELAIARQERKELMEKVTKLK